MRIRSHHYHYLAVLLAFAAFLVLLLLSTHTGEARTITVDDDGGANFTKIQDAIDNSRSGNTIRVYDGEYHENIVVHTPIYLIGNGSLTTIINGSGYSDGDGVTDSEDAFPNDPAASKDSDGDGYPDEWNKGKTEKDSTTGLKLDEYPDDPDKWEKKDEDEGFIFI